MNWRIKYIVLDLVLYGSIRATKVISRKITSTVQRINKSLLDIYMEEVYKKCSINQVIQEELKLYLWT